MTTKKKRKIFSAAVLHEEEGAARKGPAKSRNPRLPAGGVLEVAAAPAVVDWAAQAAQVVGRQAAPGWGEPLRPRAADLAERRQDWAPHVPPRLAAAQLRVLVGSGPDRAPAPVDLPGEWFLAVAEPEAGHHPARLVDPGRARPVDRRPGHRVDPESRPPRARPGLPAAKSPLGKRLAVPERPRRGREEQRKRPPVSPAARKRRRERRLVVGRAGGQNRAVAKAEARRSGQGDNFPCPHALCLRRGYSQVTALFLEHPVVVRQFFLADPSEV
jgi:hypothetical protein